ncbi:hypothetical protein KUCAC02_032406 [Chaenocephalus aceratus]|nr:hypothetical protein KUCAC02_032406 [Chaenocephalus aceratus]
MKEATQYMSKEKTPTLSVIAPLQDTLINGLQPIEGESAVIKEMKAAMSGDLQKRGSGSANAIRVVHLECGKERAVKVSILHPVIQSRLVHWLPFLVVNDYRWWSTTQDKYPREPGQGADDPLKGGRSLGSERRSTGLVEGAPRM